MFYDENFKRYEGRENDLEEHNLTGSTEIKKNYLEFSDAAFDDAGRKSNNQSSTKSNSINISRHSSRNNSLSGQSCSRSEVVSTILGTVAAEGTVFKNTLL